MQFGRHRSVEPVETAEIIADVLGLPAPHTHAGLVERSYGDGEGAFVKDRKQFVGEAERPEEVVARGLIALDDLYELHANDHLIIVSHGSFIRYMLDHITGIPTDRVENAEAKEFRLYAQHTGGETCWFIKLYFC